MSRFRACLMLLVMLSAAGCASPRFGPSDEWRLRNLEEKFLEFNERQNEQAERIGKIEGALEELAANVRERRASAGGLYSPDPSGLSPETLRALAMYDSMFEAAGKGGVKPEEGELPPEKGAAGPETAEEPAEGGRAGTEQEGEKAAEAARPAPAQERKEAAAKGGSDMYSRGLALVRGGKPAPGRTLLERFASGNPKHELVPNALYWIGESYYDEDRFDRSILAFKEVYRRFPKHPKAAAALLKTAYSYQKLGDLKNAEFYLTVLLEDFPDSEPASLAEKKMAEIGS